MEIIDACFAVILGAEGGYDACASDPGNWTGGSCGAGECLGTKFGVDSASYAGTVAALPAAVRAGMPGAVRDLTLPQAAAIFRLRYWNVCRCDDLPPPLALIVADAAYNNGPHRAAVWLQQAVGAATDGAIGPRTIAAVAAVAEQGLDAVAVECVALRTDFMARLDGWATFGLGWSRRLAALPYHAMAIKP